MRHRWWCDGNSRSPFILFSQAELLLSVTQSIFFLLLLLYTSRRDLFAQRKTQPIEKMQFAKSYQADRPTRRSRGLDSCQQCRCPPPLYVLHIKAKRFAQVLQEKWFGYQIDLLDRIECSNWMRGRENKFLTLFENSCPTQKRLPVSPRLLTLDRFLSRVNRSSSDCDSCHYIRIFSDRMKL